MAYTSVKGGADAILAAERLIQELPLEPGEKLLELRQIRNQMRAAVDQAMGEGGLYAPDLAALAVKQAEGDMAEASFMVRAYRSTLPRLGYAQPARGDVMLVERRISSSFRDIPGGQLLGRTRDYTQRLLDLEHETSDAHLAKPSEVNENTEETPAPDWNGLLPKVSDAMRAMGIMKEFIVAEVDGEIDDITRHSMRFPVSRPAWLQALSRSETGAMVCLAYSSLRGYGGGEHGTIAELRVGDLPLNMVHPLTGKTLTVGHYRVTECEMTGKEHTKDSGAPKYGLSYGLTFGQNERKAISMSLLDSALMVGAEGEGNPAPANDQEMVLYNSDGIESFGFVEHLKLPHFVTFGSGLQISLDEASVRKPEGANPTELVGAYPNSAVGAIQ